jgi:peptide/nickel transport system permease protein
MLTAVFGAGMVNSIIAIGIFNIPTFARITRARPMPSGRANTCWPRAPAAEPPWRITLQHVLPNILSVLIVQATIQSRWPSWPRPRCPIWAGHAAARASWGRMLSEAQTLMFQAPAGRVAREGLRWRTLGLNLLGDGLRDLLDPRQFHALNTHEVPQPMKTCSHAFA